MNPATERFKEAAVKAGATLPEDSLSRLAALWPGLRAALVDMDGTLYDSMPRHAEAWHTLCAEIGIDATRDEFFLYEGRTGASTINLLFKRAFGREASPEECKRLYHRKTELFAAMPAVEVMPGAQSFIGLLADRGTECVLVTGSGQNTLLNRLDSDYPGIFVKRITSRDVTHGKPAPEPYLKALAMAGATASEAIVVENAPLGVESGVAAGVFTLAVTTGPIPRSEFVKAGADLIFDSMEQCAEFFKIISEQ